MHEQGGAVAEPCGRLGGHAEGAGLECVVQLIDRGLHHRLHPKMFAGQHARELEIVIAEDEQAFALVNQVEHHPQGSGTVRTVVGQVAKLHDEAIGCGGVCERGGVAVDVANHSDLRAGRDR